MGTVTYNGSTAGSTSANPPVLLAAAMGGHVQNATTGSGAGIAKLPTGAVGAKLWMYQSTNVYSDIFAAATFNDGYALGMAPGDAILMVQTSADSTAPVISLGVLVTSNGSTSFTVSSNCLSSTAA